MNSSQFCNPVVRELTRILSDSSLKPVSSTGRMRVGAEILNDSSHGVWILSTKQAQVIVMRWLASPAPSVPRVSHPHNGLIPPEPRGFVSHHIRP
jgi:hypothetical protein